MSCHIAYDDVGMAIRFEGRAEPELPAGLKKNKKKIPQNAALKGCLPFKARWL